MHDPRVGRFFAVDPLSPEYPHYTPYSFSGNKVIAWVELEGLEENTSGSNSTEGNKESGVDGKQGKKGKKINSFQIFTAVQTTTIVKEAKQLNMTPRTRVDRSMTKSFKTKDGITVNFDSFTVPDQLIITDSDGNEVVNTGMVATMGVTTFNLSGADRYRIRVTPSPGQTTAWTVSATRNYQKVITKTKYKFLGFILLRTNRKVEYISGRTVGKRKNNESSLSTGKSAREKRRDEGESYRRRTRKEKGKDD